MKKQRVVVTGVGVVAPNGHGKEAFWQALMQGLSGVRPIRRFDSSSFTTRIAGEINDFNPLDYFEAHEVKKMDRSHMYAIAASELAVKDSGLDLTHENRERVGSSIGNAACGVEFTQQESEVLSERGPRWGSPYLAIAFFPCGSNGLLSIRLGIKGPVLTFTNGNTSGSDAIGSALRLIQNGRADIMFAGGTEAPIIPLFVGSMGHDGWLSQRNDSPETAARPFDQDSDGLVLSEGAGMLILESLDHALARGAHIYAELTGYSVANAAYDVLRPEANGCGLVRTMKEALREADVQAADVGFVNAQGFSLREYDQMESRCIGEVFGREGPGPHVSAVSSWIGNSLGAMGGIQGVVSALALDRQTVPPHGNIETQDPAFPIQLSSSSQPCDLNVVVQNSYCFLGKHASLVFKKYE